MTGETATAAAVADAALAAAVEAVVHGATPATACAAARAAALAHGAGDLACDAGGEPFRKGRLVAVRVTGNLDGAHFACARTVTVGYDTLPEADASCGAALATLTAAARRAVHDAAPDGLASGAGLIVARRIDGGVPPVLTLGEVWYLEAGETTPYGPVALGDMVLVGTDEGVPLTVLAHRLWL